MSRSWPLSQRSTPGANSSPKNTGRPIIRKTRKTGRNQISIALLHDDVVALRGDRPERPGLSQQRDERAEDKLEIDNEEQDDAHEERHEGPGPRHPEPLREIEAHGDEQRGRVELPSE